MGVSSTGAAGNAPNCSFPGADFREWHRLAVLGVCNHTHPDPTVTGGKLELESSPTGPGLEEVHLRGKVGYLGGLEGLERAFLALAG